MTKSELRKTFLDQRLALSITERAEKSRLIAKGFFANVDLSRRSVIHCFVPIEKFNEVNTYLIIDEIGSRSPGITVALPRVNIQTNEIESLIHDPNDVFEIDRWGIPEPADGEPIDPATIDLVLVPLLCFDTAGHRVGYGKGFYDRFLKTCRPDCLRVGLSFFAPVDRIDDTHAGDVRLDLCITPENVYHIT